MDHTKEAHDFTGWWGRGEEGVAHSIAILESCITVFVMQCTLKSLSKQKTDLNGPKIANICI